jgi:hypothetical protein
MTQTSQHGEEVKDKENTGQIVTCLSHRIKYIAQYEILLKSVK